MDTRVFFQDEGEKNVKNSMVTLFLYNWVLQQLIWRS